MGTDQTFGFDSAVNIATEAVDRLHTTANSHGRVMILEVMGHNAGWIALYAGMAGGGDIILIPEIEFTRINGAEIAAVIAAECISFLDAPVVRSASLDTPVPMSSKLEWNFME